ncbi:hypothetical protein AAC387_Pa03g2934 [Persea americana]
MDFLFLIVLVAVFANGIVLASRSMDNREIKRQLKLLNKHAVKTIKSEDGDIMDCVDIYKQPSLDHPLLKNHTIQMRPSISPKGMESKSSSSDIAQQGWQKSESCPEGTIPIRRTQKKAMAAVTNGRSGSLEGSWAEVTPTKDMASFSGASANINVWNVYVEPSEYSSASILVSNDENFIKVGWHVYPEHYADNGTHFYILWTADGNRHTGCYNLLCPGFIHVDRSVGLGRFLRPLSTYDGAQYIVIITLALDQAKQSWWLKYGEKWIGYWPLSLFSNLYSASHVRWSGEVLNTGAGRHTVTQMGSGHFSNEGFKKAAYFANAKVRSREGDFVEAKWATTHADKPSCYDVGKIKGGMRFYYGGPGVGDNCS